MKYYLSVLAIFKNETMNMKVWLDHYLWQGVDHFYIIDNGSTDKPLNILQEYIDKDIVTLYSLSEKHQQSKHYQYVFDKERLKENTHWLIVCDFDEFFYGRCERLSKYLTTMEKYNVIYSFWLIFGTDGHVEHPKDIRYIVHRKKTDKPTETKYIFKPNSIVDSSQIWLHWLLPPKHEREHIFIDNYNLRLNHYVIQSYEYFQKIKMKRGDADKLENESGRNMEYFYNIDCAAIWFDGTLKELIENPPSDY